jgi:deoxyribose-phosphate aldolase
LYWSMMFIWCAVAPAARARARTILENMVMEEVKLMEGRNEMSSCCVVCGWPTGAAE